MSIEIFEKALQSDKFDSQSFVDLLHDAGFTDVALDGNIESDNFQKLKSDSGVYGLTDFYIYIYNSSITGLSKLIAVKDESRKSLIIFSNAPRIYTNNFNSNGAEYSYYNLVVVNGRYRTGVIAYFSDCGVTGGDIKNATDTDKAKLVPFMSSNGLTWEPFYVAMNRVNYPINTVVTDGTNSFTSLGNLFYIKNV